MLSCDSRHGANARSALFLGLILLVTACGADDRAVAPQPALVTARQTAFDAEAQVELAAAAQGRHQRGFEDALLSLEALVPEVGGAYLDADGEFVLLLTDLAQRTKAGGHLRTLGAGWRLPEELRARLGAGRFRVVRLLFTRGMAAQAQCGSWHS